MQPLLAAPDGTLVLDTQAPGADQAAQLLIRCAELLTATGRLQTYRLTMLSLWQAAAAGETAASFTAQIEALNRGPLPPRLLRLISEAFSRCGLLWMEEQDGALILCSADTALLDRLLESKQVGCYLAARLSATQALMMPDARGTLKAALARIGYPVDDRIPFLPGTRLDVTLRPVTRAGRPFALRAYQQSAVESFLRHGSGVVVLPCGAGKTAVGIGALAALQMNTLIFCPSVTAINQWQAELLDKTTLLVSALGEWSGEHKSVAPVTLATYQILARRDGSRFPHFERLTSEDWGLVIYDEVHLLPAPVFRMAAALQARRRLGLTATLVREDGHERDVFSLIGPQRFAQPWRELERQGWIAPAECIEVRVPLPEEQRRSYALADGATQQARIAAESPAKAAVVERLLACHRGERILIIGQYLVQLEELAQRLTAPLLTGRTPQYEREQLYERFRRGEIPVLIVSKVANLAVDLPDASVAIQVSGAFGSRQEEAQRLGRVLRPKEGGKQAHFYTLVSTGTREEDDAARRQRFLVEQGYRYRIVLADEITS